MPKKKKDVLYVDDRKNWTETLKLLLEDTNYNLITFNNLQEAKEYWGDNYKSLSLVICDGSINEHNDGRDWATEIHSIGHKVLILSGDGVSGKVPFLDKGLVYKTDLPELLKKLIGRDHKLGAHPAFLGATPGTEF